MCFTGIYPTTYEKSSSLCLLYVGIMYLGSLSQMLFILTGLELFHLSEHTIQLVQVHKGTRVPSQIHLQPLNTEEAQSHQNEYCQILVIL